MKTQTITTISIKEAAQLLLLPVVRKHLQQARKAPPQDYESNFVWASRLLHFCTTCVVRDGETAEAFADRVQCLNERYHRAWLENKNRPTHLIEFLHSV